MTKGCFQNNVLNNNLKKSSRQLYFYVFLRIQCRNSYNFSCMQVI